MADAPTGISRALREAPPDRVVEAADVAIRAALGASGTSVFVADYRISGLWPVLDSRQPAVATPDVQGTVQRCFSSQQPVRESGEDGRCRIYVPLSVWGERLSMAAELQWELLPGRSVSHDSFQLAGQLEPAYTVGGDHFDWSLDDGRLTVTVLNGDGIGLAAALLTSVTVNAMRNARRSGGGLVEQAELASDTVYYQHRGHRHVATLLLELDCVTGRVRAVDAGSPHLVRVRGGAVSRVTLEQQLPLGMFGETRYDLQEFDLDPGDRLFIVSDGVWAADPSGRETYGERAMARAMRATRLQPPTEAVGTVMRELQTFHADTDLRDDAVVVCLDWRGSVGREQG
ncbi:PP2C family protein-serine/threonine phosphatase [Micromonospora sp. NPDC000442]|uniref:PP2C family protein-serine/threonine phosphatase n=1 Tax=Micromonospora sp. NPDC000442 TaxID=3364217 RepID=UPI00369D7171